MKKAKIIGKKTLSVFLAVLMVLTAWVWVAPTEASAAAGSYYVKISWQCTNAGNDYAIAYPGYANRGNGNCVGISLYYKSNNGTGTESEKVFDLRSDMNSATSYTETATISGFPTRIFVYNDHGGITDKAILKITKIEIGASSTSTLTTIWGGTISLDSTSNIKWAELKSDYTSSTDGSGDASVSTTTKGWTYPYADESTITWSNTPEAMTCPKSASDTAANQTVAASAKDQYGVQMFDPTWSVKGSNKSDGITVSPSTSSASTTISVTSAANIAGTTNSQTGTVTATWTGTNAAGTSIAKTSSKTFTINDATYTATFKNHRNADGVLQSDYTTTAKYGVTPTAPTASDYSEGDYDYTFTGWNPTVSGITADTTYTAVYSDGAFVSADYTDVNNAIAAADAIKAQYGTEYEFKYTHASRTVLDAAINAVVTGLGRTQQETVDGYAEVINDAIAALEPNKFDVIFLDKDGAILLYEKDVEYKGSVTAPSYSAKYYDSTNHYTFTGWDTNEYTSVVDDLVIQPVFVAEGHIFTTETVTSNCVTKGATKYTCSCGYSYIDGESDYGDHVWATDYTTDLEPTCTVAGSKSIHCTLCDAQKDITAIDPAGHNWGSYSVAVEATCGKIGISTRVCDVPECKVCEHLVIDALEHDYVKTTVNPTCTTKGYDEYVCQRTNCGHLYRDNYTDVVDHSYGAWETVSEAYCGVPGVKKQTCTDCGHVNIGSIDALEHDSLDNLEWNVIVAPTCEGKGYQTKTCSKCNNVIASEVTNALTHNYVTKTVVAPTCTSKGYTIEECDRTDCGAQRIVNETSALNHAWTSIRHEADCTHSAYIEHTCGNDASHNYVEYVSGSTALTHDFTGKETIITSATCEADGKKTVKCSRCDVTNEVIIPKLGHNYGQWEVVTEATNNTDGQWKRVCGNNAEHIEYITIPKGGHEWDNGTVTKAATCKETGTMLYKCNAHTNCEITLEVTIPVAQHSVAQRETPATCTKTGTVEAYCQVCNQVFSTEEIPVVPHTLNNGTAVAPTCTTSGYTLYECTAENCDFGYKAYDESQPANGHTSWTETSRDAATCTADGSVTYKCNNCTETKTEILPKTGHNFVKGTVTAADCITAGTEVYTCSCGDTYTKFIEAAKGHTWNNTWTVVREATDDKNGVEKTTCTVEGCGEEKFRTTAPIGNHEFDVVTVDATCTTEGSKTYTCNKHTDCAANYIETIPANGHTEKLEYTAPSCIEEGSTRIVCSVESCKAEIMSEEIPATGIHDFSGAGVKVDATCTAEGSITYTCKTDGCNETKVETIPAKGHTFVTTVTDAKCGEKGSVITECTVCNDPTVKKTTELAAKSHIWETTPTKTEAATCETDGSETYKCQNCDETNVVVLPKLGHIWSDWTVIPSTNNDKGSVSRECSTCKKTESVDIPAGGHNLVEDTTQYKAPTCTVEGKKVYKCNAHTDCGITLEVAVPVAQHGSAVEEKKATCEEGGYIKTYCPVCKTVFSNVPTDKIAHVYTAGTPVAPTCSSSGYTPYTCTCGDTYNKYDATKPATGHSLVEGASTATCTAAGAMTLTCKNCTYSTTVDVPALGHNYVEDTTAAKEATCAAAATKTYECSCGASYTVSVGDKLTGDGVHNFGAWTVKESATASSLGYQIRTCNVCGKMEVETIPATGEHNFNTEVDRQEATCTEKGWVKYACSTHTGDDACGKTSTVELPANGHTETLEYQAASCTENGYTKIVCSVDGCDYKANKTEIPALGHLYGEGTVAPSTCNTKGSIAYECTRSDCNDTKTVEIATNANAHQYETVVTDSTCKVPGSVVTKCKLCNKETTNKTLPLIEHSWNSGTETTKATCTADGIKTYTCTNCTATKTESIAKLGHNWNDWVKVDATNDTDGSWTRTCKNDVNHIETVVIPKGNHNLVEDKDAYKAPSCTAKGERVYKCTNHDGCTITVTVELDIVQHELQTTKTDATCEGTGTVVTKCKNCDTATITTTIPATGHTYDDGVKTPASCTATGKIVYTCTAKDCGKTKEVVLDMLQHNYVAGTPVAPTCKSSGYTPYKCENCESSYVILGAAATGHTYVKDSSTADCENGGVMTLKCACGETMETDVPALGHNYQLQSKTAATCAAAATETYKCTRCEANYTVSVGGKLTNDDAHDWNDWVTVEKADYDSIGYKTRICKICDKLEVETIPATGSHKIDKETEDKKDATCTEDGYIVYACSIHDDCGLTSKVILPKEGHDEELSYKAATCEEAGYTKIVCSRCGELKSEEIPALDHAWTEGNITNSTCSAEGSVEFSCTRAGCTETKTVEIPKNAYAHSLTKDTEPATCKKDGSVVIRCTLCGEEIYTETLPKLQHNWGTWSVKTPSTNSAEGEMIRYCDNGCEDTVKIPAGGHAFGNTPDSIKRASCTVEGSATYKCTAHTNCGVEITVVLDKIQHTVVTDSEAATCEKSGYVKVHCSECDEVYTSMTIGKLAHNDKIVETKAATCTTAGYTTFECENCSRGFSRLDAQPTGHKYLNEGAVVTTYATCTTAGYTTYNCDNCDETHTVDIVTVKGHDWTDWTVTKEATNTEKGELSRTCKNGCDAKETAEIPAGGHKFNVSNPANTTTGDCQTKGTKTFKCTEHDSCGITITVETEFGAHDWTEWTKIDATNESDGLWSRQCNTCKKEETLVIPAGNHNLVEDTAQYIAPKCDAKGQRVYKCDAHENCSVTITVVLEKIQHTPEVDKKDATCTEDGYVKTYCTACDEVISNVTLQKTGHVETTTERKESTCIEKGYEKVICKCGELVSEKELPLTAHNYDANGDGKVDKNDASFENGKYTYTCQQAGCRHTITEDADDIYKVRFFDSTGKQIGETLMVKYGESATAPAAPNKAADANYHYEFSAWDRNYSAITSDLDVYPVYEKEAHFGGEATCTEKAVCEKCNTAYGETDDSKHVMATEIVSATCDKPGSITYYCSEGCGKVTTVEEIKAMGHDLGNWEVYQVGSCAAPTIKIRKCRNYGCDKYEKQEIINSHEWYVVNEIPPTCTNAGYSEYKYCLSCGVSVESVKIPELGHRDNNGDGRCDYCTYVQNEVKCNCMCHSTGFMKFIYSIVRFFWRLTKSTPSCSCGAHHY